MPSEFQMILMALQGDLNAIMISSLAANNALSNLLGLYNDAEYTPDKNKHYVSKWAIALSSLANALEAFQNDSDRLETFLNGQG